MMCSIPYPVLKLHKENFKKEVQHLVLLGVIENSNKSKWGVPYFTQTKYKTNQIHLRANLEYLIKN